MTYPKGIDVASYQSSTFSLSGLSFVVVKATESNDYVNPHYAAQVAHVRAGKKLVGHYHFIRPGSVSAQADYFLKVVAPHFKAGDFLALDWEDTGVSGANKDAWIRYVKAKKPGVRVILYCNVSFWKSRDTTSYCGDGLWIADPSSPDGKPAVSHAWLFQQTSITGGTDVDIANVASAAALVTWAANKPAPAPKPTPTPKPTPGGTMTEAQMIKALYADLMVIKRVDNGAQHGAGYFVATDLDETLALRKDVAALTVMVQQIHDAVVTKSAPAPANPEQSEQRHAGR